MLPLPVCKLYGLCGGAKRRRTLPVASAQRRPILCFEFSDFVEPSVIGCTIQLLFLLCSACSTCNKFLRAKNALNTTEIIVKPCSQSQTVSQNLRTQNTELVAIAQTLQRALFLFSLLRNDCRVFTQATLALNRTL